MRPWKSVMFAIVIVVGSEGSVRREISESPSLS